MRAQTQYGLQKLGSGIVAQFETLGRDDVSDLEEDEEEGKKEKEDVNVLLIFLLLFCLFFLLKKIKYYTICCTY